jgi:hypothetical protein
VAETLLAAIVMMLIFTMYRNNQKLEQTRQEQTEHMHIEQFHEELMQYSGATLQGDAVRGLITGYRDYPICITVDNGKTLQSYNYEDEFLETWQDDTDFQYLLGQAKIYGTEYYIDPLDKYHCSVTEDEYTGDITELLLEREEADLE